MGPRTSCCKKHLPVLYKVQSDFKRFQTFVNRSTCRIVNWSGGFKTRPVYTNSKSRSISWVEWKLEWNSDVCIGYCTMSRLYAVLETWGMLHNQRGQSPRWLCNIAKVSINSVEPRHSAITDLDYGREICQPMKSLFVQQEVEPEKCSYIRNLSQPMKSQLCERSASSVSIEISTSQWNHCFASSQFKLVIASC